MAAGGTDVDFGEIFAAAPASLLVTRADRPRFTVVAVTERYLRATATRRDELVGRSVRDVGGRAASPARGELLDALERVVASRGAERRCHPVWSEGELAYLVYELPADEDPGAGLLGGIGHELRTPLNSLIGFSDLLAQDARELTPVHREQLRFVRDSARHLQRLIEDLLDLADVTAGRCALLREPIEIAGPVTRAGEQVGLLATQAGVRVMLDLPDGLPPVHADAAQLARILVNLLTHAVRSTPRGGLVRVSARGEGAMLALVVRDPGERGGHRGESAGLALSRGLLELHGGSLEIAAVDGGTTCTARLPVATTAPAAPDVPARVPRREAPPTVLVVDDEVLCQRLVHTVLSRRGYLVSVAGSLAEARAVLRRIVPSVVVTDISFPGGGGRRLLEELRADPDLAEIPVLALTAHAMDGDRDRVLIAGFDAYLSKPVDIGELERQIELLLERRRQT